MVCRRCILSVEDILTRLKIPFHSVQIGEAHLTEPIDRNKKDILQAELKKIGLELIDNRTGAVIEKIKELVILKARNELPLSEKKLKLSSFVSKHLNLEYTYLSGLFSDIEGITIEHFYILQRIEKAKELIVYGQLNLSEIAMELEFSSVAHLSSQFKKVTGLTPSHFRTLGTEKRKALDGI